MINVDHGILPACTAEVRDDIEVDNADLGMLGSLVYLGLVIGKFIIQKFANLFSINA